MTDELEDVSDESVAVGEVTARMTALDVGSVNELEVRVGVAGVDDGSVEAVVVMLAVESRFVNKA